MAGDPLAGGGFVVLNGITFDGQGRMTALESPYPGANLFSLASGGAIYIRDPRQKVVERQLNGGVFSPLGDKDWRLIRPYLEENEPAVRRAGSGSAHGGWRATDAAGCVRQGQRGEALGAGRLGEEEMSGRIAATIEIEDVGGMAGEVNARAGRGP